MLNKYFPRKLGTPHIELLIPIEMGLNILGGVGSEIIEERDEEHAFYVNGGSYELRIYEKGGFVKAVWYNDPLGRSWAGGLTRKTNLYLERYGSLENWEIRMNNGWMKYFFNDVDQVQMVYGIHNDVIRFNTRKDLPA